LNAFNAAPQSAAGVVSFHGLLKTARPAATGEVKAKILVCTGSADPLVPAEQVVEFEAEMIKAETDWEVITYGRAQARLHQYRSRWHSMPGFGYSTSTDARSWLAMQTFSGRYLGRSG
jgi:dienelactone hydrolase